MNQKIISFFIILLTTISLYGCSIFYSSYVDNIEVERISKIKINNIKILSLQIDFGIVLDVLNDNTFPVNVSSATYKVYFNDNYLGRGNTLNGFVLKREGITQVEFPISVTVPDAFMNLITGGVSINYRIDGEVKGNAKGINFNLPFEVENNKIALQ